MLIISGGECTKHQDEIVSRIYSMWIAYFGCPGKFLSDDGAEFNNDGYREMNGKLNTETATTAAESPFNNGIVEKHNLILAKAMKKTLLDVKCEPQIALWLLVPKMPFRITVDLVQINWYWPQYQYSLYFNRQTSSPRVNIIQRNMEAMHKARQNFYKQNRVRKYKEHSTTK